MLGCQTIKESQEAITTTERLVVTLMGTRVTIGRAYDGFWAVGNIIY